MSQCWMGASLWWFAGTLLAPSARQQGSLLRLGGKHAATKLNRAVTTSSSRKFVSTYLVSGMPPSTLLTGPSHHPCNPLAIDLRMLANESHMRRCSTNMGYFSVWNSSTHKECECKYRHLGYTTHVVIYGSEHSHFLKHTSRHKVPQWGAGV